MEEHVESCRLANQAHSLWGPGKAGWRKIDSVYIAASLQSVIRVNDQHGAVTYITLEPGYKYFWGGVS